MKILMVTGHRPDKLGGYQISAEKKVIRTAEAALEILKPEEVIVGMAMGWDMAVAQACIDLHIPFIAAVPFKGQEKKWQPSTQNQYHRLLSKARAIEIVSDGPYAPAKMEIRNRWMVDKAEAGLSLYNGDDSGGTANCVKYLRKVRKPMYNAWRLFTGMSTTLTEETYGTNSDFVDSNSKALKSRY